MDLRYLCNVLLLDNKENYDLEESKEIVIERKGKEEVYTSTPPSKDDLIVLAIEPIQKSWFSKVLRMKFLTFIKTRIPNLVKDESI